MNKIISISREFGSGGHEVGEKIAKTYIPFMTVPCLKLPHLILV